MGWSIGFDSTWQRDIGYGVPTYCDYPECDEEIHRGLAYVCGNEPYGGENGCGLFFCGEHLFLSKCQKCIDNKEPFEPKVDHPDWIKHKLTDESWQEWRNENEDFINENKF